MKVAVFGLGYVGTVNAVCFAHLGHQVIGVDVDRGKVEAIRRRESPVHEPRVAELLEAGTNAGLIEATDDAASGLAEADVAIVCVGTPSNQQGAVDTTALNILMRELSEAARRNARAPTILVRSTIPPGTSRKCLDLVRSTGFQGGSAELVFYPEFLREGAAVSDFFQPARTVLGTLTGAPSDVVDRLLADKCFGQKYYVPLETAEFVKYVDNAFHALKVAFANEVYSLGAAYDVDTKIANELFLMDNKLNISDKYLRAGAPFGGSCLGKDLRALQHLAANVDCQVPLLSNILSSNEALQQRLLANLRRLGKQRVLIAGLTFKDHTDDLRESPMVRLAGELSSDARCQLELFDEDLCPDRLGSMAPALSSLVVEDLEAALARAEVVVAFKRYSKLVATKLLPHQVFVDAESPQAYAAQTAAPLALSVGRAA